MTANRTMVEFSNLTERLEGFFSLFQPTIELAEKLIETKVNAQELVLLLCARLDALASCTSREDESNRQSFIRLVVNYGGHRDLMEGVSAGDLYYELGYHRWLTEGLIPKPGRLTRFSHVNDPILHLLERSGIPLTVGAVQILLTRLMRVIENSFRCRPGQPLRKPMIGPPKAVMDKIRREFSRSRDVELRDNLEGAIRPLLEAKTIGTLLYGNFRNGAVHGLKVQFDENTFFKGQKPYWEPLHSKYYPPFMFVKFPGPFLLDLLRNCTKTLKQKMLAMGKLPPDVHFHAFGPGTNDLQFLDESLLPKSGRIKLQVR
jgi:hypothetical protein